MYAGDARASLSVTSSSSSRVVSSDGSRDAFWERVLLALPDSLLSALRAGDLDDPGVLCEYPKLSVEELVVVLGEMLEEDAASLGAATSWTTGTTMPSEVTVSSRISSGISAATVLEASCVDGSVVSGSVLFSVAWGAHDVFSGS